MSTLSRFSFLVYWQLIRDKYFLFIKNVDENDAIEMSHRVDNIGWLYALWISYTSIRMILYLFKKINNKKYIQF